MTDQILQLAKKLKALADRGVGGGKRRMLLLCYKD
jgi:hypothetical protein